MFRTSLRQPWVLLIFVALLDPLNAAIAGVDGDFEVSEMIAEYTGDYAPIIEAGVAEPRSLGVGDLDEDGVEDLVVGLRDGARGLLTVHFGNADAIFPRPDSQPAAPFRSRAAVLPSEQPVDLLAVGDFDADGHLDVVTASSGGSSLLLRRGAGNGRFESSTELDVGGSITALTAGDINKRDGLSDLVVATDGGGGPRLLVYEWPEGALRSDPEIIWIERPAVELSIERVDGDSLSDIVVSTGASRTVVMGRDRRLSAGSALRASVPRPTTLPHPGSSSSPAKRNGVDRLDGILDHDVVARVEMRLNRDAIPDSVVIIAGSPTPLVVTTTSRSTFIVDSTADTADYATSDGVCDVDDSSGDGPCTLRAAIEQANASAGADAIEFNIQGAGPHTIQPVSALPTITDAVTIDGFSQPGSSPNTIPFPGALDTVLMIDLDGSLVPPGANGLTVSGGSSSIRGLVIRGFRFSGAWTGAGIRLDTSSHIVEGCFIGTDQSGTQDRGNENHGVLIYQGSNNLIGGSTPAARNLLSGNDNVHGVEIYGFGGNGIGNTIQGNLVGTDIYGTSGVPGAYSGKGIAVRVYSDGGNWVGGSGPGEGNVVSIPSFCSNAIDIYAGRFTVIQGNLIGTNATGTGSINSACKGVFAYYDNSSDCTLGGTQPGAGNVISGNQDGVWLRDGGWTIQGNFIGVLADGSTPLGNSGTGIYLSSESDGPVGHLIGGDVTGAGNIIANNAGGPGINLAYPQVGWPTPPSQDSFLGNSIYNNAGLGIEICSTPGCAEGPTPNDPGDSDTGSNYLQNYPVITNVSALGSVVGGNLNSTPSSAFRVELFAGSDCDPSGHGEGARFVGFDSVTTDTGGDAPFSVALATSVPVGDYVTATATDTDGNTSEFSACYQYAPTADLQIAMDDGVTEVLPGDPLTYTITVTNAGPDGVSGATFGTALADPLTCSTTCVAAGGATCTPGPVAGDVEEPIVLPVGGTATYTVDCVVGQTALGSIETYAAIDEPAPGVDPNNGNNSHTDVNSVVPIDYGDAPDPSYPTLSSSDGARHRIAGGLHLGTTVDADPGGQPSVGADGDDGLGIDDEDGVALTDIVMTGFTAQLEVVASAAGVLNAWLDLDGNGSWLDAGEQIFTDQPVGPGINPLSFPVPATAAPGDTYARFRLDSSGGLDPTGFAADGEVEDHAMEIRFSTIDVAETGQTTSYAAGDDGAYQTGVVWPVPRFTDNGDGSVTDELTGLMWAQDNVNPGPAPCSPGVTRNWFLSLDYVDCLNSNSWLGHTDWRMPNIVELGSLVHYGIDGDHRPWWSSQGFTMTTNHRWWSSTTRADGLGAAVTMSAFISFSGLSKTAVSGTAVWPVRGGGPFNGVARLPATGQETCWDESYAVVPCAGTGQDGDHRAGADWPSPRFEVSGDCVTDRLTGLTWTRDANLFGARNWTNAVHDANGLSLCGFDDWRLPSAREAQTLSNFEKRSGSSPDSIRQWWLDQGFVNVTYEYFWSSTTHASAPDLIAWTTWGTDNKSQDTTVGVWPVRGGIQNDGSDLQVIIDDSADPVDVGANVTYTIDVANLGPTIASSVVSRTTLPAGSTFVSASGTGWTCSEADLVVTCDLPVLDIVAAAPVTIEVTTPPTFGTMTVSVVVDSANDDPIGDNNGAVEDTLVTAYDFGDAPDPTYPTLQASNGASHTLGSGLFLGPAVDDELDGQPSPGATGDDTSDVDDEDGVAFTTEVTPGGTAGVDVEASAAGLLNAWVDFNTDGDWDDAGEQIFTDEALTAGTNSLSFTVPAAAVVGGTFARFRLDSVGGLLPTGAASDGEVEDYMVDVVELDFGDAPDPTYPTLQASNGARHLIDGAIYLGTGVDADPDGQPAVNATGDDNDGQGDDEDGISFITWPVAGQVCSIRVTSSATGTVNAWIDYNGDGDWADPGEHVFADVAVVAGANNLDYTIPADAVTGIDTYARFRISSVGGLSFDGLAPDGEVEDHRLTIVALDFGDAPDPTYPTMQASDGARHIIGGLYLGSGVDLEADGQPTAAADGDDSAGTDDENGVVFTSLLGRSLVASLDVTASAAGALDAWIDFNADGDWDDPGEQIFTSRGLAAGSNPLSFTVPVGATLGITYARFRLSSAGGLAPSGYATDGEVEDYEVEILEGPDLAIDMIVDPKSSSTLRPVTFVISVTNNGPVPASAVTVTDTLPPEVSFVSSAPAAPDCVFAGGTLTCDLGVLQPSDTAWITVETSLDPAASGSLSNTATVTAAEVDPIWANDTVTVSSPIAFFADGFETGDTSAWN